MKLKSPNLLNPVGIITQENYGSFYHSESFTLDHFIMRHPVIVICREIVVGEHTLNTSPDCRKSGDFCLPENQTLTVDKIIQHPMWNIEEFQNGYDIALVRVKGHIKLFVRF